MENFDGIEIRQFNEQDYDLVLAFFNQMNGETRALFNRNDVNLKTAMQFFNNRDMNMVPFMALENGRMVGYVFLWDLNTGVPWLGIAVAEDYKGKHLGRKLIEYAHDYARQLDKGGILLTTNFANIRGQGLYERMGYKKIGTSTDGELLYIFRFTS